MIIDFHTHIFPPEVKKRRFEYIRLDPGFQLLYSNPRYKIAAAEDLIESMDRAGIDISVVFGFSWSSHELCVEANDYVLEAVRRYPDRLVGFCVIQPLAGEAALYEIARCAQKGMKGIGEMLPHVQGFDLRDDVLVKPIVEKAMEYGLILLVHASEPIGHSYPGKGDVTPEVIYRFVSNFPHLTVVFAHWGGGLPFYSLMPEVAKTLHKVYFDTAASSLLYRSKIFGHVIDLVGSRKVLFGSDAPLIDQARLVKQVKALRLTPTVKEAILGGNAESLLRGVGVRCVTLLPKG